MKIKVLAYGLGFVEREIPDDIEFLRVTLMTGDEIIEIYKLDEKWGDPYLYETLDMNRGIRSRNFLDATYIVYPNQFEEWNERRNSYHIYDKEKFRVTYEGYFSTYRR